MEKYIKSDTVLKFINGCLEHEDKITDVEKAVLTGVKTYVERIPTNDMVEIRNGQKIDVTSSEDAFPWYKCSVCGYDGVFIEDNYCSHCGVKFDE